MNFLRLPFWPKLLTKLSLWPLKSSINLKTLKYFFWNSVMNIKERYFSIRFKVCERNKNFRFFFLRPKQQASFPDPKKLSLSHQPNIRKCSKFRLSTVHLSFLAFTRWDFLTCLGFTKSKYFGMYFCSQ